MTNIKISKKPLIAITGLFISILLVILSFYLANLFIVKKEFKEEEMVRNIVEEPAQTKATPFEYEQKEKNIPILTKPEVIEKDAIIHYEYNYVDENKIEEVNEKIAPYFVNMDKEKFISSMLDWEVVEFSSDKIIVKKDIKQLITDDYTIGAYNGYITVFYNRETDGTNIKEITDTPITSLSEVERNKIENGIKLKDDNELFKFLQDYGS